MTNTMNVNSLLNIIFHITSVIMIYALRLLVSRAKHYISVFLNYKVDIFSLKLSFVPFIARRIVIIKQ